MGFDVSQFREKINSMKLLRDPVGIPVIRSYTFNGANVEITFFDTEMKDTKSPSHTNYWEVKIRDIDPILIRSFELPVFSMDVASVNLVKVTMMIPEDFDESKYHDIILDEKKPFTRMIEESRIFTDNWEPPTETSVYDYLEDTKSMVFEVSKNTQLICPICTGKSYLKDGKCARCDYHIV